MKFADIGAVIWVIIFVMISLAKGWSKLQRSVDDDSSKAEDTPSVPQPRPQRSPPRLPTRPAAAPIARAYGVPPQQRTAPRATARAGTMPMSGERKVSSDEIRRFVEQLSGKAQPPPPPPPVARPPARKAEPPLPPTPEPVAAAPVATQTVAAAPAQTSRASQWMEALRDRNNIRNIVIAAEIIGPPRAESV